jgi:hypothetical protein
MSQIHLVTNKMPAANGRFGASGAVSRPKICTNLEVLRPSERQCKLRLRQAAGTLVAMSDGSTVGQICNVYCGLFVF